MPDFYIREFGEIHKGENNKNGVDKISINAEAWDFLAKYAESDDKENRFLRFKSPTILKVQNFVGVISTPDGTQIEILPKINQIANKQSAGESRKVLADMLKVVFDLPFIKTTQADLQIKKQALPEVLIGWFLQSANEIIKRGIRRDYNRIEAHEPFLKGQLQTAKQFNEPPHKQHLFHIEYDIFSPNRAENRLIHSALLQVLKWSKNTKNQRLAKHFLHLFDEVALSNNYKNDFAKWSKSRDMNYYQSILPWLKLILNQQSPFALNDKNAGISFLFPMEVLFEKYVAKILVKRLLKGYKLREQISRKYLSNKPKAFLLKPDIGIYKNDELLYILDTKWKLIDENKTYENDKIDEKKGISQSDMYQLFAYGKKYNVQKLALIYPQWSGFESDFEFEFDEDLHLRIVPFRLDNEVKMIDFEFLKD